MISVILMTCCFLNAGATKKPNLRQSFDSIQIVSVSAPQTNNINIPKAIDIDLKGGPGKSANWELIITAIISILGVAYTMRSNKIRERNNIIRQARIVWIQDLRKNLSLLPIESERISLEFGLLMKSSLDLLPVGDPQIETKIHEFIKSNIECLAKIEGYCHLVILHLNPDKNAQGIKEHEKLEKLVEKLAKSVSYEGLYKEKVNLTQLCSDIMKESREIMKFAWNQAQE